MSKKESLARPAIILTLICFITVVLLVLVYQFTKPYVEAAEKKELDAAMVEVLPDATEFEQIQAELPEGIKSIYQDTSGKGYVVNAFGQGYGGELNVTIGIDADMKIVAVKLMANSETPGLGSRVGNEEFSSQFVGKDKNLEGVELIHGATISSKAYKGAVENALSALEAVKGDL